MGSGVEDLGHDARRRGPHVVSARRMGRALAKTHHVSSSNKTRWVSLRSTHPARLFPGGVSQLSGGPPENRAASPRWHDCSRLSRQLRPLPSRTSKQGCGLGCIKGAGQTLASRLQTGQRRNSPSPSGVGNWPLASSGDDVPFISRNGSSSRRAPDCRCCEICT
jgi:hypothetical protein